jgi:hypothetical protein
MNLLCLLFHVLYRHTILRMHPLGAGASFSQKEIHATGVRPRLHAKSPKCRFLEEHGAKILRRCITKDANTPRNPPGRARRGGNDVGISHSTWGGIIR